MTASMRAGPDFDDAIVCRIDRRERRIGSIREHITWDEPYLRLLSHVFSKH